jgi:glycosyltransferase involved in cell wall biosynthesis
MKICVLVNDTSFGVMGLRARHLATPLTATHHVDILYREAGKLTELRRFIRFIRENRPDLLYIMNVGYAGGGAALLAKYRFRIPYILDHGDPSYALLRSSGRPLWEALLVRATEWAMLRSAYAIVARGGVLAEAIRESRPEGIHFLPDGVDLTRFKPINTDELRNQYGVSDVLTLGIVGSIVWSDRYQMCYGWDIIEVVARLKDLPVKGIIVGDGTGITHLKKRAKKYGIQDRICFTGRVAHDEVPRYINMMDVCISTQTNDVVGHGRTTAKLPEYLACGRFIIATDVGGAREVVHENGFLLPYQGVYDPDHPARLTERIEWLLQNPDTLSHGIKGVEIARNQFDYNELAQQLSYIIDQIRR